MLLGIGSILWFCVEEHAQNTYRNALWRTAIHPNGEDDTLAYGGLYSDEIQQLVLIRIISLNTSHDMCDKRLKKKPTSLRN